MFSLARSLLLTEAVSSAAMAQAMLVSAAHGTSLVSSLLVTRAIETSRLEQHLERGEAPTMRHVAPVLALVERLPPGLCERLLALPVRRDPRTGTIDVAVVDAADPHPAQEISRLLGAPVRLVRTSLAALDAALQRARPVTEEGLRALAAPMWMSALGGPRPATDTPAYGSPVHVGAKRPDPAPAREGRVDAAPDPNIPFSLTRGPVLALTRPKSGSIAAAPPAPPSSPQPVTQRGPFARPAPLPREERQSPDRASVLDKIGEAADRDAILELVVTAARTVARRVAVLAVRRGSIVGWTCSDDFAEPTALRAVRLSAAKTVLALALHDEGVHRVRLPLDAMHAPLLWVMNTPALGEVAMTGVRVEKKAVALVLAAELDETAEAEEGLDEIARTAGAAMTAILKRRRK